MCIFSTKDPTHHPRCFQRARKASQNLLFSLFFFFQTHRRTCARPRAQEEPGASQDGSSVSWRRTTTTFSRAGRRLAAHSLGPGFHPRPREAARRTAGCGLTTIKTLIRKKASCFLFFRNPRVAGHGCPHGLLSPASCGDDSALQAQTALKFSRAKFDLVPGGKCIKPSIPVELIPSTSAPTHLPALICSVADGGFSERVWVADLCLFLRQGESTAQSPW